MIEEQPQHRSGLWSRLSGRTKLVIVVDFVVLAIVLLVGAAYVMNARSNAPSDESSATNTTTTTPSSALQTPGSPLQSPRGLAYVAAACGGAMTLQGLPESPLPRADDYAVCLAPASGVAIALGVYDDRAAREYDMADFHEAHRYLTYTDEGGAFWLALVEGDSPAPLAPLERYGFETPK